MTVSWTDPWSAAYALLDEPQRSGTPNLWGVVWALADAGVLVCVGTAYDAHEGLLAGRMMGHMPVRLADGVTFDHARATARALVLAMSVPTPRE